MNLCVSAEMPSEWLSRAQQIKLNNSNLQLISTMPEGKEYIYDPGIQELNGPSPILVDLVKKFKNNLILCVSTMEQAKYCKDNNIRFYFKHYITSYYELRTAIALGAEYIIPGAPLFFEMNRLKYFKVKLRAIPNLAYFDGYMRKNGVVGTWIRPEDLALYENYIDTIEFYAETKEKEKLLLDIYCDKKEWLGTLNDLVHNFDYKGFNNMFDQEVAKRRLNCGQRCQKNNSCHSCFWALELADPEKIKPYLKK